MDSKAFDRLTTSFTRSTSRRSSLILGLVALTLGVASDDAAEAGGNGKKKKNTKKNKKKNKCGSGEKHCALLNTCVAADGCCSDSECPPCKAHLCVEGRCQCYGSSIEHNGVCGRLPNCKSTGEVSTDETYSGDCCSDRGAPDGFGNKICQPGTGPCLADADCESGPCRGFMCPELYNIITHC